MFLKTMLLLIPIKTLDTNKIIKDALDTIPTKDAFDTSGKG